MRKLALCGADSPTIGPDSPTVLTVKILYTYPGKSTEEQGHLGRGELMSVPFREYERQIRQQFTDMFARTGFDASRDIAGIILNRWGLLGLMGLPWDELETFLHLRDGILRPDRIDPNAMFDAETRITVQRATGRDIYAYFDRVCDERERHPTSDILSHLVSVDIEGKRLTREEILDICFLFLIAGLDTVSDSLTCFYAFLANHPEHRRQIVDDPQVIPGAVEELLRWESPVPAGSPRIVTHDTELPNGVKVAAGSAVLVNYGAANIDESEFSDPFAVLFDRQPNRHIAFGAGVHRCLGSHLARRELRIALREWHRRIPEYSIKPGHEELVYPPGLRSVENLTLVWPG